MVLVGPGEGPDLLEGVPVVGLGGEVLVAEGAASLGDLRLQGVAARTGGPDILEQDVHAHAGARIEREPDQQLGGLACRHRQPITIPASLDCAENGDSEHHPRLRQRRPGEVSPGVVSAPSAPWSTVHVCPTPTPPSSSA